MKNRCYRLAKEKKTFSIFSRGCKQYKSVHIHSICKDRNYTYTCLIPLTILLFLFPEFLYL